MEGRQQQKRAPRRWSRPLQTFFPRPVAVRCEERAAPPAVDEPAAGEGYASAGPPKDEAPVQFENFSQEWQSVSQQDNWDGFRMEAMNQVTKHLQAAHSLFLGTQMREAGYIYQFGPGFQTEDHRTMIMARAGLDGSINGRLVKKIGTGFELKMSSNSHLKDPQRNMQDVGLEYAGSDWAGTAKLAWQGAWIFGGAYSQRLLPGLQLGGDLTVIPLPNGVISNGQVGLRWANGLDSFSATLGRGPPGQGGISYEGRLQYMRRISERLSLGSAFNMSLPDQESGFQVAYEYMFRNARLQGSVDADGKVSCCVNDGLVGFSGMIDYAQGDYKFGVMMQVLPPQEGQPPQ